MRRAFNECRAGKEARERLRGDFEKKQKKLDADQEELKKLLARGSAETDPAKKDALGRQVEERTRALQELFRRFQKELEEAEKAATGKLLKDIRALVPPVAQVMKLVGVAEAEAVYFTDPEVERVDVTAEIVKRLDAITPKPKAPPPAPPAKAPGKAAATKLKQQEPGNGGPETGIERATGDHDRPPVVSVPFPASRCFSYGLSVCPYSLTQASLRLSGNGATARFGGGFLARRSRTAAIPLSSCASVPRCSAATSLSRSMSGMTPSPSMRHPRLASNHP
jgi:Skp family chaperone for outer membrane proteins